ncbi:hypothetical protein [Streptomyces californicus]|uniref:hypothetical protein n=1 Tax=Streptomyces californicus TaxID=67351 RepID=UPI00379CD903
MAARTGGTGPGAATVWLTVLQEYSPHLLMPDPAAAGRRPAAPFLDDVAAADPAAARTWLDRPAVNEARRVRRAQRIGAAGRLALEDLLGLALRHRDVVDARHLQARLPAARHGGGPGAGATAPGGPVGPYGPPRRAAGAVDRRRGDAAERSGRGRARRPPRAACPAVEGVLAGCANGGTTEAAPPLRRGPDGAFAPVTWDRVAPVAGGVGSTLLPRQ